ncbi:hypothetical protein GS966_11120 [Rhodococcus hoagii]|nr:hypothetical protein [Prescottella equi]
MTDARLDEIEAAAHGGMASPGAALELVTVVRSLRERNANQGHAYARVTAEAGKAAMAVGNIRQVTEKAEAENWSVSKYLAAVKYWLDD